MTPWRCHSCLLVSSVVVCQQYYSLQISLVKRNKLTQQKLEPMKVVATHSGGRALELDIPPGLHKAPVISIQHVEQTRNPADDPFNCSMNNAQKPDPVDGADYRAMITDEKKTPSGRFKYKAHFHGFPNTHDEWLRPLRISPDLVENWIKEQKEKHSKDGDTLYIKQLDEKSQTFNLESKNFPKKPPRKEELMERPILFLSRATHAHEKNYGATELELSCIAWAFTQLNQYLEGSKLVIFSDHKPIHSVLSSSPSTRYSTRIDKARMVLMPWLDNIEVKYIEGRKIAHVEALSRVIHVPGHSVSDEDRGGVREGDQDKARSFEIGKVGDDPGPEVLERQERKKEEWSENMKGAKTVGNVEETKNVEGTESTEEEK
jgi:hypothetical protein